MTEKGAEKGRGARPLPLVTRLAADPGAFAVWNASRFTPYGLSLRGKNAVFPRDSGRTALCRLAFCLFQRQNALVHVHALPGQAVDIEIGHEGIGIELFHVPDAGLAPHAGGDHLGADHGGHAGGIGNGLRAHLPVAFLMIADIVDVDGLFLAVLDAAHDIADAGLATLRWFR